MRRSFSLFLLLPLLASCDAPDPFTPVNRATGEWQLVAPAGAYQIIAMQLTESYDGSITGGWQGERTTTGAVSGSLAGERDGSAVSLTLSRQLSQVTLQLTLSADRLAGTLAEGSNGPHPAEFQR